MIQARRLVEDATKQSVRVPRITQVGGPPTEPPRSCHERDPAGGPLFSANRAALLRAQQPTSEASVGWQSGKVAIEPPRLTHGCQEACGGKETLSILYPSSGKAGSSSMRQRATPGALTSKW